MKKSIALVAVTLVVVFFACQRQVTDPKDLPDNASADALSAESILDTKAAPVCFEGDVLPIFLSSCAKSGCHDAASHKAGYILENYRNIIKGEGIVPGNAKASEIYQKILSGEMPPKGDPKLTTAQLTTIRRWINQGANNTMNCSTCDTSSYTYSTTISAILGANCVGCHTGPNGGGGIDLSTYTGVQVVALNGHLIGTITHTIGYTAMPLGGAMLSDCNITQIEKWVTAGAPNN